MCLLFTFIMVLGTPARSEDVTGIVAFDCNNTHLDVLTYDLTRVAECPRTPNVSLTERPVKVQILQKRDMEIIQVRRCHVTEHTLMWHCGMHSHTSMANYNIAPTPYDLTEAECRAAHSEKTVIINDRKYKPTQGNGSTTFSDTLVGEVWGEGYCTGGSITIAGYAYKNVVVKKSYIVTLQDRSYIYKVGSEEIISFGGATCRLADRTCFDYEVGRIIWSIPVRECHRDHYDTLYAGAAVLTTTTSLGPHTEYIRVTSGRTQKFQIFTPLLQYEPVCGLDGRLTPYVGLYIVMYIDRPPFPLNHLSTPNVDIARYIETKFMTFAYGSTLTTMDIIERLALAQCEAYRETLLNRLHIISANPGSANLLVNNRLGVFGRVSGEVIHILQCPAVEVSLRKSDACTLEIPITFQGRGMYMDARTRIITDVYTYKECGVLTPVMFRHGTGWVKMTPSFSATDAPRVIAPVDNGDFHFERLVSFAQGGIYDPTDLQQLREFMLFSSRRDAMSANILSGLEGRQAPRYDLTQVLHEDGWKSLAQDRLKQMWGNMQSIGEWISGFLGIYFCFLVIKVSVGMLIRCFNIYKITGVSWALLAAIWSTLTQVVLTHLPRKGRQEPKEEATPTAPEEVPLRTTSGLYPTVRTDNNPGY